MGIIEIINNICNNSIITMAISIVGIVLTVYFSIRINHKKIRYLVAREGDKYIVAFWNACNRTVFCEDLYYFYAYGNIECQCENLISSDPDVMLDISLGKDEIVGNVHARKIRFSFDFLNKRNGYIVDIYNKQKDDYFPAKFMMRGRIRGEGKKSIRCHKFLYEGKGSTFKNNKNKIADRVLFVFLIFSVISYLALGIYGIFQNTPSREEIEVIFSIFIYLIGIVFLGVICYTFYIRSMPYKLRREYKKYVNKKNYKEVRVEII